MWSPERIGPGIVAVALALAAALPLGGCNVQPLYGATAAPTGGATAATLADVDVAPVEGRVGQKIRNDLLFYMNGGSPTGSGYLVELKVKEQYTNVVTRAISGLPGGRNIRLVVTYSLKKTGGEDGPLTTGSVTRIASIDYFNQRFANDRATIDAENRASKEVAADIHLRLASYFATGRSYDAAAPQEPEDEVPTFGDTIFNEREPTYGAPQL